MNRIIAVRQEDVKELGVRNAYYLAQLRFYEKIDGKGRPFERTPTQIHKDISLTPRQQRLARNELVDRGYVRYESKKRNYKWSCKFWILK